MRDVETGRLSATAAPSPDATEVALAAREYALGEAGGLDDITALSVGGQQHGMVCLDEVNAVVRPRL